MFVLGAFWLIWVAARGWVPEAERRAAGSTAVLVLLGSIGLIVHAHEAVPDLAALAATCAAFACWSYADRRPLAAGAGFGVSLGAAVLAAGPVAPAAIFAAAVITHLASPPLRNRSAFAFLGLALLIALALSGSWLLALTLRAPDLAGPWWTLATQPRGEFLANLRYYLVTASWFAWPAWPLASGHLAAPQGACRPAHARAARFVLAALLRSRFVGPPQDINCIVLLPPLALLAPQGIDALRRGAANALDWFGVMTFGLFAALVWLGYFAMLTGAPSRIAKNFTKAAPGFTPEFAPLAVAFSAALLLAWLVLVVCARPSPARGRCAGPRASRCCGQLRNAVAAMGRLPEKLSRRGAAAQGEDSAGREMHRALEPRQCAARGAQLPCGHPHAAVRPGPSPRLPAGDRAGQPAARSATRPAPLGASSPRPRGPRDKNERFRLYRYKP
jgi:4-amino-4-deoxy-L-arabinose transferase-like glycosyltransferase